MSIRKLKIEELGLLTQLFEYNDITNMIAENTKNMNRGITDIFCAFQDDKLIGELHVNYESEDTLSAEKGKRAYLYAFRVHKDYQGNGIGTLLLNGVIEILDNAGYKEFTVGVEDTNTRARHMYMKHGFITRVARKKECYQGDEYEYDLLLKKCDFQNNRTSN